MKFSDVVYTYENLSENGTLGATEDALAAAETATDVAEGTTEMSKDIAEIDSIETAIDDAHAADGEIGELLEAAEESAAQGGMSEREAKLMEISTEAIFSKLGLSHRAGLSATPVASFESFKSNSTRMSATRYTIASLEEAKTSLWDKIVAVMKAAMNAIMSFLSGLLRNRALLERHLKNLQKAVSDIKVDKMKKETFGIAAAALTVDGKADAASAGKILDGVESLITASSTLGDLVNSAQKEVDDFAKGKEFNKSAQEVEKYAVEFNKHLNDKLESSVDKIGALTHGRKIEVKMADHGFMELSIKEGNKGQESIEAPTKGEMSNLIGRAVTLIGKLREFEKTQTKLKNAMNNFIEGLSGLWNFLRGAKADDAERAGRGLVKMQVVAVRKLASRVGSSLPGAAFMGLKAVADYVAAGVRNMGGEIEKAPAGQLSQ